MCYSLLFLEFLLLDVVMSKNNENIYVCQAQSVDLRDLPIARCNLQIVQRNLRIPTLRN